MRKIDILAKTFEYCIKREFKLRLDTIRPVGENCSHKHDELLIGDFFKRPRELVEPGELHRHSLERNLSVVHVLRLVLLRRLLVLVALLLPAVAARHELDFVHDHF